MGSNTSISSTKSTHRNANGTAKERNMTLEKREAMYHYENNQWRVFHPENSAKKESGKGIFTFSTISYNIWFEPFMDTERYKEILKICQQYSPNVICFQEVTKKFLELLEKEAWIKENYMISDLSNSMATFSDWYGVLSLVKKDNNVKIEGMKCYTLESGMGRRFLNFDLNINGIKISIGTVHLESLANSKLRALQLDYICSQILNHNDNAIVMGDFNFDDKCNFNLDSSKLENEIFKDNKCVSEFEDVWAVLRPDEKGNTFDTDINAMINGEPERMRYDRVILKSRDKRCIATNIEIIGTKPFMNAESNKQVFPSDHFGLYTVFNVNN